MFKNQFVACGEIMRHTMPEGLTHKFVVFSDDLVLEVTTAEDNIRIAFSVGDVVTVVGSIKGIEGNEIIIENAQVW